MRPLSVAGNVTLEPVIHKNRKPLPNDNRGSEMQDVNAELKPMTHRFKSFKTETKTGLFISIIYRNKTEVIFISVIIS